MLVSVILPAYNAEKTIGETIESILQQTFSDFEFIIINDGSTDRTEEAVLSYKDERIKYYANDTNKGLIYTLNKGLSLAKGKYIARMDADDIALPERFEKQIQILENNPSIIVCGSLIKEFGNKPKHPFVAPEKSENIKNLLIRQNCIAHPSTMIRKNILEEHNIQYDKEYIHAEDYNLWIDLSDLGDFYNIQETLLLYRISDVQISQVAKQKQHDVANLCRRKYIYNLLKKNNFKDNIQWENIDASTIKKIKQCNVPKEMLEVFYLSLSKHRIRELLYFIFSGDFAKISFKTDLAILRRFVQKRETLL